MADLNEVLSNIQDEDVQIDHDNYVDPQEFGPPIPPAIYAFTAGAPDFNPGKEGWPYAQFTHTVASGDEEGKEIRFATVSTKPFERGGVQVSQATDFLRSCGDTSRPQTKVQTLEALAAQEGKPFKGSVDWEGWCKQCETAIKGQRNFPQDENEVYQSKIDCPTNGCTDPENGEPATVYANARIQRYIPA